MVKKYVILKAKALKEGGLAQFDLMDVFTLAENGNIYKFLRGANMTNQKFNHLLVKMKDDRKAFEAIYAEYYPRIVVHIDAKFRRRDVEGKDIGNEVFLKLWNSNGNEKFIENPLAWLYVISDRIAMSHIRKLGQPWEELTETACADHSLDEYVRQSDFCNLLNELEPNSAQILFMEYFEGYSLKEISDIMGMNYSTARGKSRRALKNLKKILKNNETKE